MGGSTVAFSTSSTYHPFHSGTVISLSTVVFSLINPEIVQRTRKYTPTVHTYRYFKRMARRAGTETYSEANLANLLKGWHVDPAVKDTFGPALQKLTIFEAVCLCSVSYILLLIKVKNILLLKSDNDI